MTSAYIIQFNFGHDLGKSFMHMLNNKGPKIEHCGTPIHIRSNFEFVYSDFTCCCLFVK